MRTTIFALLLGCFTLSASAADPPLYAAGLQEFQGQYELADGRLLVITQRGRRLLMQLERQAEVEVVPAGNAAFETKSGRVRLEFVQYPNGNVPAVRVIDNADTNTFSPRQSTQP